MNFPFKRQLKKSALHEATKDDLQDFIQTAIEILSSTDKESGHYYIAHNVNPSEYDPSLEEKDLNPKTNPSIGLNGSMVKDLKKKGYVGDDFVKDLEKAYTDWFDSADSGEAGKKVIKKLKLIHGEREKQLSKSTKPVKQKQKQNLEPKIQSQPENVASNESIKILRNLIRENIFDLNSKDSYKGGGGESGGGGSSASYDDDENDSKKIVNTDTTHIVSDDKKDKSDESSSSSQKIAFDLIKELSGEGSTIKHLSNDPSKAGIPYLSFTKDTEMLKKALEDKTSGKDEKTSKNIKEMLTKLRGIQGDRLNRQKVEKLTKLYEKLKDDRLPKGFSLKIFKSLPDMIESTIQLLSK